MDVVSGATLGDTLHAEFGVDRFGTANGAVTLVAGGVQLSPYYDVYPGAQFSVAFWLRIAQNTGGMQTIVALPSSPSNVNYPSFVGISLNLDNTLVFLVETSNVRMSTKSTFSITSTIEQPIGQWMHVALVYGSICSFVTYRTAW